MAKHYVLALVHKEEDAYGISFPDYPGVISGGDSFNDAINRGANALVFHLQGLAEDGEEIPPPSSPDDAIKTAAFAEDGAMPALIEIEFPGRAVRINISIEEGLLARIDREAKTRGQSRSGLIAAAARSLMAG